MAGAQGQDELLLPAVGQIEFEAHVAAAVGLHHAVLVGEVSGDVVFDVASASRERQRVCLRESRADGFRLPVGVDAAAHLGQALVIFGIHRAGGAVVESGQTLQLQLLGRVAEVVARQVGKAEVGRERVADAQRSLFHALAFDDDDAVGRVFAIEGRGRSILQDVHALDVVDVDVIEVLQCRFHTVDDHQRGVEAGFVVGGERRGAADDQVGDVVRVGTHRIVLVYLDGWVENGERLKHVVGRDAQELLGGDGACRAGECLFGAGEESVDHHLVHRGGVFLHDDGHARRGGDYLLLVAYEREFQLCSLGDAERETSVDVGHCAYGIFTPPLRADYQHVDSYHGRAVESVDYDTRHGDVLLCGCCRCGPDGQGSCRQRVGHQASQQDACEQLRAEVVPSAVWQIGFHYHFSHIKME